MTEKNYAPSEKEKKVSSKSVKENLPKIAEPKVDKMTEKTETKEIKKEDKKPKKEIVKKDKAIVFGRSLAISKKHSMAICDMIRGKTPDKAIEMLEKVLLFKRAVPMNWMEVPHKKGIMAGRYPINASKTFIDLLKQLKANSSVNGIDYPIITAAKADKASRPHRRGGARAKRAHIYLEAKNRVEKK